MGANYAEAAYQQFGHLTHAQLRLLVRMALIPHDKNPKPVYYAGWQLQAEALGLNMPWPHDDSAEADRLRRNAKQGVAKVVAALVDAGAITPVRRGRLGVQAEYLLNLRPVDKSRHTTPNG